MRDVLIEGRTAEDRFEKDGYAIRWTFMNELELIFVVSFTPCFTTSAVVDTPLLRCLGCIPAYLTINLHRRSFGSNQGFICQDI